MGSFPPLQRCGILPIFVVRPFALDEYGFVQFRGSGAGWSAPCLPPGDRPRHDPSRAEPCISGMALVVASIYVISLSESAGTIPGAWTWMHVAARFIPSWWTFRPTGWVGDAVGGVVEFFPEAMVVVCLERPVACFFGPSAEAAANLPTAPPLGGPPHDKLGCSIAAASAPGLPKPFPF